MSKEEKEYYESIIENLKEIREEISQLLKTWEED